MWEWLKYGIRDEFGLEEIIGYWIGAYCPGLRRGGRLAGFLFTGIKGTAPGLLFRVVRRCVRCFVCKMAFAVGLVDVMIGGACITLWNCAIYGVLVSTGTLWSGAFSVDVASVWRASAIRFSSFFLADFCRAIIECISSLWTVLECYYGDMSGRLWCCGNKSNDPEVL